MSPRGIPGEIMDRRDFLKTATTAVGVAATEQLLTPPGKPDRRSLSPSHVLQKPRKFVNASQHQLDSRNFLNTFAYSLCKCLNVSID
jgi:hypothetical protein